MNTLRLFFVFFACCGLNFSGQTQQRISASPKQLESVSQNNAGAQPCALCSNNSNFEWIENVSIGGGGLFNTPGPGYSCLDPTIIDAYFAVLKIGHSYSFALTPGFSGGSLSEYWKIWIDLNHDGDLDDPADLVYASTSGSTSTVQSSFSIPSSVQEGAAIMRVAMRRGSPPPNCGNFASGQVLTYYSVYLDKCNISFTNACEREFIQQVKFKSINNTSGCGNSGYQDFTSISTNLDADNTYQVSLTPGFVGTAQYPQRWLIWIDFNNNTDFNDSGELVFDSGVNGSTATTIGFIHIPPGVQTVSTRMRIKMIPADPNFVDLEPCDPVGPWFQPGPYGEAEDYSVNIEWNSLEVQGGIPANLVKDVLIGGDCFDVKNINYIGQADQIGSFSGGLTNIGFESGIILATGSISVAPGPNDSDGASAGYGNGTPDTDLQAQTTGATFDMADLEFDITPTQTPITLEYVFASEEYCEYVNTQYSDVFGCFISGPGINGTQNIAVVPNTQTPVGINTVNHLLNSGLYTHNTPASGNNCGSIPPSTGIAISELQYDGFTKKMVAVANVIPCETYRIKLKIADVGDGVWDSAVFFKAGSFDGGGNAAVEWLVNGEPNVNEVTEGCGTVQLLFNRVGANPSTPLPVSFTITGTATHGGDFGPISATYVIPGGVDQLFVPVNIVNDLIPEGAETVILTLNNSCSCLNPQKILTIRDYTNMETAGDTVAICGPGVATVGVTVTSGVEPYTYLWNTGNTDAAITVFVSAPTTYTVTVTDDCGVTSTAKARVNIFQPPVAQLLPPAPQLCPGQTAQLLINFTGTAPFELVYQLNGTAQSPVFGITDDPYMLPISQPGVYQGVSLTDANGCPGIVSGALVVINSNLTLQGVTDDASCFNIANGSINTTVSGGQGPYQYTWSGPSAIGNIPDPVNLFPGNYSLTVTDAFGCTQVQSFLIDAPPCNWAVYPSGRNHTIILPSNLGSDPEMPLQTGDWIGAFYDSSGTSRCAGYVIWTGGANSFAVYGNDDTPPAENGFNTGETFRIKIWRPALNQEFNAVAEYAPPGTLGIVTHTDKFADDGISMITSLSTALKCPLSVNWNSISSYIVPINPEMLEIFSPIASSIDIVKDGAGNSMIPSFQINNIGDWDVRQGYQLKANQVNTLRLVGPKVIPESTPIQLQPGWQLIGYLRDHPQRADSVFRFIKTHILVVKDNAGMIYSPQFGINTIGTMKPCQAYKVNALSAVALTYEPNFTNPPENRDEVYTDIAANHFVLTEIVNTGNNATIILPRSRFENGMLLGDEIGVFTSTGTLCGRAVCQNENLAITVWGDDPYTHDRVEGMKPGETYHLRVWRMADRREFPLKVRFNSNTNAYTPDGIEIITELQFDSAPTTQPAIPGIHDLEVFPNPASTILNIRIHGEISGLVRVAITATDGSCVMDAQSFAYSQGDAIYSLPISAKVSSGMYCLRFQFETGVINHLICIKK